jgi:hypothetical protein
MCFGASAWLRSRRRSSVEASGTAEAVSTPGKQLTRKGKSAPAVDDEFAEIEQILKNRGIT